MTLEDGVFSRKYGDLDQVCRLYELGLSAGERTSYEVLALQEQEWNRNAA